jgi:hypothetical protein
MPCPQLADVLAENRLDACCWAAFHCKSHGDVRAALPSEPARQQPCPLCQSVCRCVVMARGGTRGTLPAFWLSRGDWQTARTRWDAIPPRLG